MVQPGAKDVTRLETFERGFLGGKRPRPSAGSRIDRPLRDAIKRVEHYLRFGGWGLIEVRTEGTLMCDFRHRNELHVGRLYDLPDCSLLLCRAGGGPARTRSETGTVRAPLTEEVKVHAPVAKKAEAPRKSSPTRLLSNHEKPGPDEDRDRRTLAQQSLAFQYRSVLPSLQHDYKYRVSEAFTETAISDELMRGTPIFKWA